VSCHPFCPTCAAAWGTERSKQEAELSRVAAERQAAAAEVETYRSLLQPCVAGRHQWVAIYSAGPSHEESVIRWCSSCGTVVGDLDYDGRSQRGAVLNMQSPVLARRMLVSVKPQ
jgi:hypothetical protein